MFAQSFAVVIACALVAQSAPPAPVSQSAPSAPLVPTAGVRPHEDLAGTWKYNADESVNAATGRPETARAVNNRRGGGGGGVPRVGPGGVGSAVPSAGDRTGGGVGDGYGGGGFGMPPSAGLNMYQQMRDTLRDLMEIAPALTFAVTPAAVTVTDDLKRSLTFPTDGKKQKYQLAAAVFEAKTYWDGAQLRKDIEGPNGLKMTETYFLSEDGARLFLIIRVGEQTKGEPPNGVNRAYDRSR